MVRKMEEYFAPSEEHVIVLPRSYKAAVMLLKKKRQLEAYHDDLIPSKGIDTIHVSHPKDISHLNQIAEDNNRLRPDDIAYAYLTVIPYYVGYSSEEAKEMAKKHMTKALESVGISKRFRYEIV